MSKMFSKRNECACLSLRLLHLPQPQAAPSPPPRAQGPDRPLFPGLCVTTPPWLPPQLFLLELIFLTPAWRRPASLALLLFPLTPHHAEGCHHSAAERSLSWKPPQGHQPEAPSLLPGASRPFGFSQQTFSNMDKTWDCSVT